jgi:hypothetical protein
MLGEEVPRDPNAVYALGSSPGESERLLRQAEELASDSAALLERLGLRPGQHAVDLGCGPRGVLTFWPPGFRRAGGWSASTPIPPMSLWRASSSPVSGWTASRWWSLALLDALLRGFEALARDDSQ